MTDMKSAPGQSAPRSKMEPANLDKIFIRDLVLDCEVGVYPEEQNVTQKVGFSVVASVDTSVHSEHDEIAEVPSYDDLIKAVKSITSEGHINLVETLAERIAEKCLSETRIVQVRVRVDKLERGPAAVGVEIIRPRA